MDATTPARPVDRWEKWAPVSGIVFVGALLGLFFGVPTPPEDPTSDELGRFFRDNEAMLTFGAFFLVAVMGLALLWFTGSLRTTLMRAETPPGRVSSIAFGAGVAAAILFFGAGSGFIAGPVTEAFDDDFSLDTNTVSLVESMGFLLFLYAHVAAAGMVGAASVVALRTRMWARWWSWVGIVLALALFLTPLYFFGFFVLMLWVLVTSVLLIRNPRRGERATVAASMPG